MDILFVTHLLNGLLMIAMPIGLAVVLIRRWKLGWRLWLVGGATFLLAQVGHVPFNLAMSAVLNRTSLVAMPRSSQVVFSAVFLGLSAGLWEELFRCGMFRWWLKDARSWRKAVVAGAGWGGVEAIVVGTLAVVAFVQLATIRGSDLSKLVPVEQLALAQQQVAAYWSMSWYDSLLGALERLLTIPTQIALSVLVLQAFARNQWFWIVLAVGYHASLDAAAVLALSYLGPYPTEAIGGGFALVSLILIFVLRRPEPAPVFEPVQPVASAAFALKPLEETPEKLEDTRYV